MALIKCPECKKEVSTKASSCPNCGYPLAKVFDNILYKKAPAPKSSEWLKKWESKPFFTKIIVFVSFLISLVLLIIFVRLLNTDLEAEYNAFLDETFYYEKGIWILATSVFGFITFFMFICFIISLFMIKISIKNIDGYNVVVYFGFWKNYLYIEDNYYDSNWGSIFHNTLLSGDLPNGKQLTVTLSSGSASFKVESLFNSSINNYIDNYNIASRNETEVNNDKAKLNSSNTLAYDNKDSNLDASEIIKRINEDLLMLSYQTDPKKIEDLKSITKEDYQKLLKCSNVNKEELLKIEKRITDMFIITK